MRDYQQQRVYDWEAMTVPDGHMVQFNQAQSLVDYIWKSERLTHPPQVEPIHSNTTKSAGKADRFTVYLQPVVTLKCLIHELAHSMTSDIDGSSAMHGPLFVGVYAQLLERYLKVPMPVTLYTCKKHNVDIMIGAHPVFLDD